MYAYIRGKVAIKTTHYAVIDVHGVGYKVSIPQRMLQKLILEQEATIYTHLQVREDDLSLYGFTDSETLSLFELLLTVSGVGPKLALGVVNSASATSIYQAILENEITALTKIPGVGKKTAQRLVLELKEKITALNPELDASPSLSIASEDEQGVASQVAAALASLGYRPEEAIGAMRFAQQNSPDKTQAVDDLLRETLKYLGSRKQ